MIKANQVRVRKRKTLIKPTTTIIFPPTGTTKKVAHLITKLISKSPKVDLDICIHCNICVNVCPVNAIIKEILIINNNIYIRCFSCIKYCKSHARLIKYFPKQIVSKVLSKKTNIN